MHGNPSVLTEAVKELSKLIVFLFTTGWGLAFLATLALFTLTLRIAVELRKATLAERASGGNLGPAGVFLCVVDAAYTVLLRFLTALPAIAMVAAGSLAIVAAGEALERVERIAAAAERIRELSAVVRNLERSVKVADVRVLDFVDGRTRLELSLFDPSAGTGPVDRRELILPGRDIYFDAIVLNFDYSQIETGRRVNLAIPYRVFSEELAQNEGLPLGASDQTGIPYAFKRSDDDIYGIAPEAYRARLAELMSIVKTDAEARREGIVRSLYGAAVHKKVVPGDRFEIRLESSGGMTVKERFAF